jgi:hypothetical protein
MGLTVIVLDVVKAPAGTVSEKSLIPIVPPDGPIVAVAASDVVPGPTGESL